MRAVVEDDGEGAEALGYDFGEDFEGGLDDRVGGRGPFGSFGLRGGEVFWRGVR